MLRAPLAPLLGVQACGVCKLPGKPDTPPPSFTWYPAVLESVRGTRGQACGARRAATRATELLSSLQLAWGTLAVRLGS